MIHYLFHMSDSQLEAFVRPKYHKTKNIDKNDIQHTTAPSTYYNSQLLHADGNNIVNPTETNNQIDPNLITSGFHVAQYLNRDSSAAQVNVNESKVYLDQKKIIYAAKPIVAIVGIETYNNNNTNIKIKYMIKNV